MEPILKNLIEELGEKLGGWQIIDGHFMTKYGEIIGGVYDPPNAPVGYEGPWHIAWYRSLTRHATWAVPELADPNFNPEKWCEGVAQYIKEY